MPVWLLWIYRRWGQILCFSLGGAMILSAWSDAAARPDVMLASGASLLATALGLKALLIWKERPQR